MNKVFDVNVEISKEFDFSKPSLDKEISKNRWVQNQWPLIYIINNRKKKIAYVGETTDAVKRITNHLNNEERKKLNKIRIIGSDIFNKSATLDIEAQLIQHLSSEGTYELQNGNNGLTFHNYYQQHLYKDLFKEIWKKLIQNKIVNRTLSEIQNSNLYKYSPYKSLNQEQFKSVIEIIKVLNEKIPRSIFVKGSAGTGKTLLATYLIKFLTSEGANFESDELETENSNEVELLKDFRIKYPKPKIALVVAMTSLRKTLQNVFASIAGLDRSIVISPSDTFKKKYDILIVDESHRLRQRKNISFMGVFSKNNLKLGLDNNGTELDWILANSTNQIFFYDSAQTIKPSDIPSKRFSELMKTAPSLTLELKSQMRVSAGTDYITFVDDLLNCRLSKSKSQFELKNYELEVFESFRTLYTELTKKEKEVKLCRLVAGYSWPWLTGKKNSKSKFDIELEGLKFRWNRTPEDWIGSKNSFDEIGCIHTTQGYDLNYVGVIFGREISYNPLTNKIEINSQFYFDKNGKKSIPIEDLKEYIINIYKTIMYRGIKGTFIYAVDKNLRAYLSKSINKQRKPIIYPKNEMSYNIAAEGKD